MTEELSEKQEVFVEVYCQCIEDGLPKREAIRLARDAAHYAQTTSVTHILTSKVVQAILDNINKRLALAAPEALRGIEEVLSNPERKGASNLLAAAQTLLDRVGVTKKESQEVTLKVPSAVIILPPKAPLGTEQPTD
jgi:hypothetical protein